MHTSTGVIGHLPFTRLMPGLSTRFGRVNFLPHPFARIASISDFSVSPPSNTQQEKATMSYKQREKDDAQIQMIFFKLLDKTIEQDT